MMHYEVTEACFHHKDRNHRSSAVSQILLQRRCRPALGRPLAVKNNSHWLQDKSQEREERCCFAFCSFEGQLEKSYVHLLV